MGKEDIKGIDTSHICFQSARQSCSTADTNHEAARQLSASLYRWTNKLRTSEIAIGPSWLDSAKALPERAS
jgi:hypothetical protein